jgi:serine/threonine protein phosphatase PrpC
MVDANRRRLTVGRADPGIGGRAGGGGTGAGPLKDLLKGLEYDSFVCIHSTTDSELKKKRSFAEKDKAGYAKLGSEVKDTAEDVSKLDALAGVKCVCKKGLKPESPNQDSYVVVIKPGEWGLYGVFDGHGPKGHDVSDFAVGKLVMNFLTTEGFEDPAKTGKIFSDAFVLTQDQIENDQKNGGTVEPSSSGSTCTMAFHNVKEDILTLAHVGDSRAVLYKMKDKKSTEAVKETEDHKPNLPNEKKRIEANGGRVVFDGYYNYRVFAKAGMYPGLNMSRALGDVVAHKEAGLTAEPELNQVSLKDLRASGDALLLIIASDGVWEFIQSKDAPDHLKQGSEIVLETATVEKLAKKSWDSWMEDSDNEISDDISIISVIL